MWLVRLWVVVRGVGRLDEAGGSDVQGHVPGHR